MLKAACAQPERARSERVELTSRLIEADVAHVTAPRQVSETDYGRLLRIGVSDGPDFYFDDEELLLRLAEPWFDEIRTRVARDGLRVYCFVGYDMYTSVRGASARLLRPDGSQYPNMHKRRAHEAMMLADWGEVLRLARSKHAALIAPIARHSDLLPEPRRNRWRRLRRDRSEP